MKSIISTPEDEKLLDKCSLWGYLGKKSDELCIHKLLSPLQHSRCLQWKHPVYPRDEKWGVALGIWQQFTTWIKTPTLTFSMPGSGEKVLFSWCIKRKCTWLSSVLKNGERKREEKRNIAEVTPRNLPFYSAQLNFINHRKSEMEKTY